MRVGPHRHFPYYLERAFLLIYGSGLVLLAVLTATSQSPHCAEGEAVQCHAPQTTGESQSLCQSME